MGKRNGVAFGKAVFAEALDLAKAVDREVFGIAAVDHAVDHAPLQQADIALRAKRRHRLAQLVGLAAGEFGSDHGDAHRLLLEQRYTQRLVEDAAKLVRVAVLGGGGGKRHVEGLARRLRLPAQQAVAQIRMDHLALDRARSDDRDLNDQIVEDLRPQARQHRHLRPALDLEHAERIGALQHGVDPRPLLLRDMREVPGGGHCDI